MVPGHSGAPGPEIGAPGHRRGRHRNGVVPNDGYPCYPRTGRGCRACYALGQAAPHLVNTRDGPGFRSPLFGSGFPPWQVFPPLLATKPPGQR